MQYNPSSCFYCTLLYTTSLYVLVSPSLIILLFIFKQVINFKKHYRKEVKKLRLPLQFLIFPNNVIYYYISYISQLLKVQKVKLINIRLILKSKYNILYLVKTVPPVFNLYFSEVYFLHKFSMILGFRVQFIVFCKFVTRTFN